MPEDQRSQDLPAGFTLRQTLSGHQKVINRIAWSPDGETLASASEDHTVHLWDAETGQVRHKLEGHSDWVYSVSWSPDGKSLASGGADSDVLIWDAETGQQRARLQGHAGNVFTVAWSPDGRLVASGAQDCSIRIWNVATGVAQELQHREFWVNSLAWSPDGTILASGKGDGRIDLWAAEAGKLLRTLGRHALYVVSVAWTPDGKKLASASYDATVGIWDPHTGKKERLLEGHTDYVKCVAFSADGNFLASKANDNTVLFWRCDTWQLTASLKEPSPGLRFDRIYSSESDLFRGWPSGLAFHPRLSRLATLGSQDRVMRIWQLSTAALLGAAEPQHHYCNAKIVLVGDSGVGKSCLGLVLSGKPFTPMESTHSRHVWTLDRQDVELAENVMETREILLWDLAGQPGYRLIHQLHLDEVDIALVVFDSRSETDLLAGVYHWSRALRQADQRRLGFAAPITKVLVAARADRDGIGVSQGRISSLLQELGFAAYFEVSAKEGWQVAELARAIREAIDWEKLPKISSTELFRKIRSFLLAEKEAGRLLSTADDLYRSFARPQEVVADEPATLRAQFVACMGRLENQGLLQRLSFGDLILLQPELLDAYAAMLISAAKREPGDLGSISEEAARNGLFPMPQGERIHHHEDEKLLLIATVEDLLRHDIALREQSPDGALLVFPSQLTRECRDLPAPQGKWVTFSFDGAVSSIYTTLVVRLSHSETFKRKEMWKNAAEFSALFSGTFGLLLSGQVEEGRGDLTLFANSQSSQETRRQFEDYVFVHLQRRSLPGSVKRRRLFGCTACGTPLAEEAVIKLQERGKTEILCYVCGKPVSLLDHAPGSAAESSGAVTEMDRAADLERDRAAAVSVLQGKRAISAFDVFLCYNSDDKLEVKGIGQELKVRGILPWLDEWELRPGFPWQTVIEEEIDKIRSAAVFVGAGGLGPWQDAELLAFLRQFVKRRCPVIPVILTSCQQVPKLPAFLEGMTWVDLHQGGEEPMDRLIWGITGSRRVESETLMPSPP